MSFHKILVAYDGSDLSKKALNKAIELAQENPARLEIIHTYNYPVFIIGEAMVTATIQIDKSYYDHAEAVIEEASKLVSHLANVNLVLKQGQAAKMILEYASEAGADLIVLGSRGLSGIREFVLGSVSHNVVQHAKVPVLIIK